MRPGQARWHLWRPASTIERCWGSRRFGHVAWSLMGTDVCRPAPTVTAEAAGSLRPEAQATYDRSVGHWRHLDLRTARLCLEAAIRRLRCPVCPKVFARNSWPGREAQPRPRRWSARQRSSKTKSPVPPNGRPPSTLIDKATAAASTRGGTSGGSVLRHTTWKRRARSAFCVDVQERRMDDPLSDTKRALGLTRRHASSYRSRTREIPTTDALQSSSSSVSQPAKYTDWGPDTVPQSGQDEKRSRSRSQGIAYTGSWVGNGGASAGENSPHRASTASGSVCTGAGIRRSPRSPAAPS